MKKYIVFGFDQYYPIGGLCDTQGSYDTLDEAIQACKKKEYEFLEIVDRDTWKRVWNNQS